MAIRDIAVTLTEAGRKADLLMDAFLQDPPHDKTGLAAIIKQYAAVKLCLNEDEISDNITVMVRASISRSSGISIEKLKEMDRPGACGSAPAVLAKRILFFLDVQGKLGVKMPPEDAGNIQTVQDLAEELLPLMQHAD